MTGISVSEAMPSTVQQQWRTSHAKPHAHRVRELVFAYRPVRDREGRIISVPSLALSTPEAAARIVAPLLGKQPVEMFAVACLSAKNRLLAWHIVSRGTRSSTPVSIPDVFVPAVVTPGTVGLAPRSARLRDPERHAHHDSAMADPVGPPCVGVELSDPGGRL